MSATIPSSRSPERWLDVTDRPRPLLVSFLATRGWGGQAAFLAASLAALLARPDVQEVPLAQNRTTFLLVWLSCAPGALAAGFMAPSSEREASFPGRPVGLLRAMWFVGLALLPSVVHVLGQAAGGIDPWVTWWYFRNHLLFLGIAGVASWMCVPAVAWIPGCGYLLVCWFLGTKDAMATPWWWALPNHLPDEPMAAVVAVGLWVTALALQRVGPSRVA